MMDVAYYTVSITNNFIGSEPTDGFVAYKHSQYYIVFEPSANTLSNLPTTLALGETKARAYYRYKAILFTCGFSVNRLDTCNLTNTGGDANTAPTTFGLTLVYDKPSYLETPDELNAGSTLTGENCIKRWVARALGETYTVSDIVYDPTAATNNSYVKRGQVQSDLVVGSLGDISSIENSITVTLTGGNGERIQNAINNEVSY